MHENFLKRDDFSSTDRERFVHLTVTTSVSATVAQVLMDYVFSNPKVPSPSLLRTSYWEMLEHPLNLEEASIVGVAMACARSLFVLSVLFI